MRKLKIVTYHILSFYFYPTFLISIIITRWFFNIPYT